MMVLFILTNYILTTDKKVHFTFFFFFFFFFFIFFLKYIIFILPSSRKLGGVNIYDFEGASRDRGFGLDIQACLILLFLLFLS